jgi:hypothetical protein
MNELSHLTRRHYERNEADASLVSKVTRILDSLPDGSVDSSQLRILPGELALRLKNGKPHQSPSAQNRKVGSDCSFHASELLENCSFSDLAGTRITLSLIRFLLLFHLYLCPLPVQFGL